ncbi:Protein yippee-like At3g08990, partial [Linum perenne]
RDENKIIIVALGAIPVVVELLENGSTRGKKDAASTLFNLCIYQGNKGRAVRAETKASSAVGSPTTSFGIPGSGEFSNQFPALLALLPIAFCSTKWASIDASLASFKLETQGNKPMGMLFVIDLEGRVYRCKHCNTHLGRAEDIISKTFRCKHGKAYLFDKIVNISIGEREDREMMTGWHTVVDISCVGCGSIVGWKYEAAHDMNQMYKVGKFIIERFKVLGPDGNVFEDQQEEGSDSED